MQQCNVFIVKFLIVKKLYLVPSTLNRVFFFLYGKTNIHKLRINRLLCFYEADKALFVLAVYENEAH